MDKSNSIKRYFTFRGPHGVVDMIERPGGDWVKFPDAEKLMNRIDMLEAALEFYANGWTKVHNSRKDSIYFEADGVRHSPSKAHRYDGGLRAQQALASSSAAENTSQT